MRCSARSCGALRGTTEKDPEERGRAKGHWRWRNPRLPGRHWCFEGRQLGKDRAGLDPGCDRSVESRRIKRTGFSRTVLWRAWSPKLSMTCPQSVQFLSWDQMGKRRRRRRLTRKKRQECGTEGSPEGLRATRQPRNQVRRGVEKKATSFGLDLCRVAFLGRRDGRTVDGGTGQDPRNETGFSPSMSYSSNPGQRRTQSSLDCAQHGMYAAGACSSAPRAPMPPLATPTLACRQSSSDRGLPANRPSKAICPKGRRQEQSIFARPGWESSYRPRTSSRTRALSTSFPSGLATSLAATKSSTLPSATEVQPLKLPGVKFCTAEQAGATSEFSRAVEEFKGKQEQLEIRRLSSGNIFQPCVKCSFGIALGIDLCLALMCVQTPEMCAPFVPVARSFASARSTRQLEN